MNIISKSLIIVGLVASATIVAAPSANATSTNTCIDGSKRSNLNVTWKSHTNVTITSVGNKPLCADTTLFYSSYIVPDTYDGKGFNASAAPQTLFDSTSVVLKKNVIPSANLTITLPEACKHKQVDVYYAPELRNIDAKGHGAQFISGYIISKSLSKCTPVVPPVTPVTPPVTPTTPETPVTPVTPPVETPAVPVTPVATPVLPSTPAELPKTGATLNTAIIASILSAVTYSAVYIFTKRS